jgi:L-cystine transport system ATP-binding protein
LSFINEIASHVIFIDDGVILEEGSLRDIFFKSFYERTKQFISRVSLNDYVI